MPQRFGRTLIKRRNLRRRWRQLRFRLTPKMIRYGRFLTRRKPA
jgi:hypothetical protein